MEDVPLNAWSAPSREAAAREAAARSDCGRLRYNSNESESDMSCEELDDGRVGARGERSAVFGVRRNIDASLGLETSLVHECMRATCDQTFVPFRPDARHLKYRRVLVDWMCEAGEQFQLAKATMFVAVAYLDRILQHVAVERNRLQLVAMCCLQIAGKYEEAEENVPTNQEINEYAMNAYTPEFIQEMEMLVLNKLEWRCTVVTPVHFLGYYLGKGVLFEADRMSGKPLVDKLPRYMKKYANFFADLSLQEYGFQQYKPSVMAAAIVAASRQALHVLPVWRPELEDLTLHSAEEVMGCYEHLYAHYEANFPTIPRGDPERASPKGIDMV